MRVRLWWYVMAFGCGYVSVTPAQEARNVVVLPAGAEHTLVVEMPYATITVVGAARDDILLVAERDTTVALPAPLPGTPHVPAVEVPAAVVAGSRIEVLAPTNQIPTLLRIELPRTTALLIRGSNGGPVTVRNVAATLEIANSNAGVTLEDIAGAAVVETSNGNVTASFTEVTPGAPMAFVTSNATIDVELPGDVGASVVLETDNGDFFSDFPIAPRTPASGRRTYRGRLLEGTIGGGGPSYRFLTSNSSIYLRRR